MKKIINKLRSFFYLLPNILAVFFTRSETEDYPAQKPALPELFRGRVSIRADNCVGCSLCVLDCPAGALEIEKESKENFRLVHFRDRCTYCGQCEQSCRYDAIHMDNAYVPPSANKEDFFIILVDRIKES